MRLDHLLSKERLAGLSPVGGGLVQGQGWMCMPVWLLMGGTLTMDAAGCGRVLVLPLCGVERAGSGGWCSWHAVGS